MWQAPAFNVSANSTFLRDIVTVGAKYGHVAELFSQTVAALALVVLIGIPWIVLLSFLVMLLRFLGRVKRGFGE